MATSATATRRARHEPLRRGRWLGWTATALAVVAAARPAAAATPAQVQKALDAGRAFLFATQTNGNWEVVPTRNLKNTQAYSVENGQWGGLTALATLSLLASGVDANDPHVQQAVTFLRGAEIKGNYALGIRAQVWGLLPPQPWIKQAEADDLKQLEQGLHVGNQATAGLYGYLTASPPTDADHSVSQFAVLGVWALAQAGLEVPTAYWQLVDAAWHRQQLPSGGWGYRLPAEAKEPKNESKVVDPRKPPKKTKPEPVSPTLSMTAAGVATLFITQEYTQIAPRCGGNIDDPGIDAGLKYLGQHLTELIAGRQYYTLFGISRVGLASGYKYLGTTDWFQWGSDAICREQSKSGEWNLKGDNENYKGVPDTAFALLFLARGRAPVMMNKLRYDVTATTGKTTKAVPGTWDQRPRDVANLARWVGKQIESLLNWQVVDLNESVADLHDAPILYMAGGKAPKLSDADTAKLRAYVEDGGLVLGHADCASSDFAKGFRALGERMFPGYEFRPLEPTSPIYTNETFAAANWKSDRPVVEALSNGSRELMVLLPTGDPARQWQSQSFRPIRGDTVGQFMIDLFLYSVDKEGLRRRGETYLVARGAAVAPAQPVKKGKSKKGKSSPKAEPAASAAVRVARVKYAGNWDPEPGGWRRLANVMHNAGVAEVTTEAVDPAAGGTLDKSYALASLTVAAADAKLPEATRAALRDYVKGGGTLLVDVAGGRGLYRAAAEAELAKLFPDAPRPLPVLPAGDPVFAAAGPGLSAGSVDYRRFERPSGNLHVPQLRGYTVGRRVAVFYSPEDVSTGLVGEPVDGVAGYVPADATKVVADVVAYAAKR